MSTLPVPTQDERNMGLLAHLLQIFTGFMGPLVILLLRQNSRFVKFHALQSLMWQVSFMVVFLAGFALMFVAAFATVLHEASRTHGPTPFPVVFLMFPLLWLFAVGGWATNVVLGIVYGTKAHRGEWAKYPIIGKWFLPKLTAPAGPLPNNWTR
jgi:uncharacterized membrane protein